jgi:hypothetical protein
MHVNVTYKCSPSIITIKYITGKDDDEQLRELQSRFLIYGEELSSFEFAVNRHRHPEGISQFRISGMFLLQIESSTFLINLFQSQPQWMRSKEYWNKSFEDRYEQQKKDPNRPMLKVGSVVYFFHFLIFRFD